ncbi:MAG TPA: glycosyltransferase [Acidobacteriota bacterium]|nr:glycosyltransferase [Acidobacteriota bacterium]HQG93203.1 glycosyltransferase [Acidobacteriota bacterium]HQK86924.1 glycosyltransferase [Acidobacteriota bacterium]
MSVPRVLITLPCHNEAEILEANVTTLREFCETRLEGYDWRLLIADNASTDATGTIGRELAERLVGVDYVRVAEKGRGRALRQCWTEHESDIYAYMDADLATELRHLPELLGAVRDGADAAIGSRLIPGARVTDRSLSREVSSRGYNLCLWLFFRAPFRDAQCGFKAVSRSVRDRFLPLTRDSHWFFDSELLLLAGRGGRRVREIPVCWRDDQVRDSKVRLIRDIVYFVRRILDLRRRLWFDAELRARLRS